MRFPILSLLLLSMISITTKAQLKLVDQSADAVLYTNGNDFIQFKYVVKSDSVYKVFFDKNFIQASELARVYLSKTASTVPAEQQKLSNAALPKINMEFIDLTSTGANKYKVVFMYKQGKSPAPHYYCIELACDKDPKFSTEFYQKATKVSSAFCGDEY
jgi:hypothetical protein